MSETSLEARSSFWDRYSSFIIAALFSLHPHLWQKLGMLRDYFTHPTYQFWTTFKPMDVADLAMHAGIPLLLIAWGIYNLKFTK
ncbi:MAG: hypothetical protein CL920_36310 [Deltaproteobacteria bacterium]|nr:hypothetical protein [Deltaproteobacteria bacterium]MBU54193.1 hypothetical protein [Deltaproteobacteria bacterium]|tara:strand:+ start:24077 stop:24328 length:252 start_codon:yes stop_codon:yes gene_type:complete